VLVAGCGGERRIRRRGGRKENGGAKNVGRKRKRQWGFGDGEGGHDVVAAACGVPPTHA